MQNEENIDTRYHVFSALDVIRGPILRSNRSRLYPTASAG